MTETEEMILINQATIMTALAALLTALNNSDLPGAFILTDVPLQAIGICLKKTQEHLGVEDEDADNT